MKLFPRFDWKQLREEDLTIGNEKYIYSVMNITTRQDAQLVLSVINQQWIFQFEPRAYKGNYVISQQNTQNGNVVTLTLQITDELPDYVWTDGVYTETVIRSERIQRQLNILLTNMAGNVSEIYYMTQLILSQGQSQFMQLQLFRQIPTGDRIIQFVDENMEDICQIPKYQGIRFSNVPEYPTDQTQLQQFLTPTYQFFSESNDTLYSLDENNLPIYNGNQEQNTQNILRMWNNFIFNPDDSVKKIQIFSAVDWIL